MNYFDEDLINELNIRNICFDILSEAAHTAIVSKINEKFPFSVSKLAWEKLKTSIYFGNDRSDSSFSRLADEIRKVADDNLIFIGDSACDEAYSMSLENVEKAIRIFSDFPQHTYIVSKTLTWIACISFEGDLNFAMHQIWLDRPRR